VPRVTLGDCTACRHHRVQQTTGAEARPAVGRLDLQRGEDFDGGGVTQGGNAVDVAGSQAGVVDSGPDRFHGELKPGNAGATADSRDADTGNDRVFFEVAHLRRPLDQPAAQQPKAIECTVLPVSTEATSQLLIEHCDNCAHWVHPAAGECRDCGGPLVARPVSGHGTVFTYTVNYHAFNPEIPTPYVIAIVELVEQNGLRVAANIVDCEPDSVACGMRVEALPEPGAGGAARFAPA
jgi:uncharacterized OB-fold protein